MKLTKNKISSLKTDGERHEHRDDGLPGLWLTQLPSGTLTWSARYTFQGRDRRLSIGKWGVTEYVGPKGLIERFRPMPARRSARRGSFMTRAPGWLK